MKQSNMFDDGSDLPLFSGTRQRGKEKPFDPSPTAKQEQMFSRDMGKSQCNAWDEAKESVQDMDREQVEERLEDVDPGTLERNALKWRLAHLETGGF